MNTIILRDTIKTQFEKVWSKVYYKVADKSAKYPYCVFDFRRLNKINGKEIYVLEVDAWDKDRTISRIESLMDDLEKEVEGNKQRNAYLFYIIYTGTRGSVTDEDETIKHIREQFELQVFERR